MLFCSWSSFVALPFTSILVAGVDVQDWPICQHPRGIPANTKPSSQLMPDRRCKRRANIKSSLGQCLVFATMTPYPALVHRRAKAGHPLEC